MNQPGGKRSIISASGGAMAGKAGERPKATGDRPKKKAERKTEKVNVWLDPQQAEWLKSKKNISETVRALITEAMNMERLAASVKKKKR
jgi:hypothetical protein